MSFEYDIVLCSVPKMDLLAPYVGPALLKSLAEQNGFRAKCIDLNVELFRTVGNSYRGMWTENSMAFYAPYFFKYEEALFPNFIEDWARRIVELNAKYIGISCITYMDRLFGELLIQKIKSINPKQLIVIGGTDTASRYSDWFTRGLIDYFILGDSEPHLLKLLKSNHQPGQIVNEEFDQIDLTNLPYPDYSDFPMSAYWTESLTEDAPHRGRDLSAAYITASRGCVRNCSFCDINHYWQKFNFRSGKTTADEMVHQYSKLGINYFYFTDSLINGNQSELAAMANSLKEFNSNSESSIRWRAQYIVRSMSKEAVHQEIKLLAESGCDLLIVGIESGSEHLRKLMGKHFSNDDILELTRACHQFNVKLGLLFLIGHPDERAEDLDMNIKLITQVREIGPVLSYVSIGHTLHILWDTPILSTAIESGITLDFFGSWHSPRSNLNLRVQRLKAFKNTLIEMGQRIRDPRSDYLESELKSNQSLNDRINEPATSFFEKTWTQKFANSCNITSKRTKEPPQQRAARLERQVLLEMTLLQVLRDRKINWSGIPEMESDLSGIESAINSTLDGAEALQYVQMQLIEVKDSSVFKLLFYLRSPGAHRFFRGSHIQSGPVSRIYSLLDSALNEYRSIQLIECYEKNFGSWRTTPLETREIEVGIRIENELGRLNS